MAVNEDLQRAAFADSGESDWSQETQLLAGAVIHHPGDVSPIRTPEEWHAEGWDTERQPPKTTAEARAALAGRIADPDAPDTEAVAGAYDDLEEG
ncbi:hypothetical protein [Amycolatopsis japonica]